MPGAVPGCAVSETTARQRREVEVEVGEHAGDAAHPRRRLHYRVAFAITASILLAIAVILPFSVAGIVDHLLGPPSGKVIDIANTPHDAADELQLLGRWRSD